MAEVNPILTVSGVEVLYGGAVLGVKNVSLAVERGRIVALLGSNGAGKSTTLKAISGLLGAERGEVSRGAIEYEGQPVVGKTSRWLVRRGLVQVLEGRHCFGQLSVEENLLSGTLSRLFSFADWRRELAKIYELFPTLKEKRRRPAGLCSGGEQQMIAIGRALVMCPRLILLDEPSMGLAPMVVEEIFHDLRRLNRENGVSFLVAEQNARIALEYSDFGYVLENGTVTVHGAAGELRARDDIQSLYFGSGSAFVRGRERRRRAA
jgi:branched-chain amino acid transport system ATP-binding protein